ncbi:adenosine deaminase-like protein [Tigriopus californicus]|uniref:adenosine deaminase-like protein n=1 Tax=Tigriopus californicus TaxID=6832 RepID=UPI0027DA51D7|nr:adenosine deaminase-like protein [Tigriopus californicus]
MTRSKVELHAHLNGSLHPARLWALKAHHERRFPHEPLPVFPAWFTPPISELQRRSLTFDDVFPLFGVVQALTDHPEAVAQAVEAVIDDFAADGVRYLELRSTPRAVPDRMTKLQYMRTILETMETRNARGQILSKYLVSWDRRQSLATAEETLALALDLRAEFPNTLVGVDLSGDPRSGDARSFIPLLEKARHHGLKLAIHLAEVPNETETWSILTELKPDRIGHGTAIHPSLGGSSRLWPALLTARIPVEVCLTSNLFCQSVPTLEQHHVVHLKAAHHPFVICTDDQGIFFSPLSQEYALVQGLLGSSNEAMDQLALEAIDYTFASDSEKDTLRRAFQLP